MRTPREEQHARRTQTDRVDERVLDRSANAYWHHGCGRGSPAHRGDSESGTAASTRFARSTCRCERAIGRWLYCSLMGGSLERSRDGPTFDSRRSGRKRRKRLSHDAAVRGVYEWERAVGGFDPEGRRQSQHTDRDGRTPDYVLCKGRKRRCRQDITWTRRSEERRVGKECTAGWMGGHGIKMSG